MQTHEAQPVILAAATEAAIPIGPTRTEGGQPVRRFRKELIRCGQYVKQSDNLGFTVTPTVLDHWVKTAAAYLSAGNKIPVPVTHTEDPEANRGWVVDVFAEGQSLFATMDLVGEAGIKLAGTCDVSIYSPPELIDGRGNKYVRPIVHVALCTDPVIPGLAGFVPIETSRGGSRETIKVPVLKLEQLVMPDPLNPIGSPATDPAATSGDPSETIVNAITEKVIAMVKDKTKTAQEKKTAFGDLMKKLEKALGIFEEEVKPDAAPAADAAPVAASRTADPMMAGLIADNRRMKLAAELAVGHITKAQYDSAVQKFTADSVCLSLSRGEKDSFEDVLAVIRENQPIVPTGERTGPQTLALARSTPTGEDLKKNRTEAGKELATMTARAAGLPLPK